MKPSKKSAARLLARQNGYNQTIINLGNSKSKAEPANGWASAFHRPGSQKK